ncbi:g5710 [Coccomyxa viridis]|uniref:G5710 protein n=1 Tax=Coccomyxa viridis TaxID=1274662 RepID=A0ABP1FTK2_9CHLO
MWTIGNLSIQNSAIVGALIVDFIIQWVGWGISASLQTDKLYDGLGSTTFAALAIGTLTYAKFYYARQILATVLVVVWAARLGGFLVFRVIKTGKDSRFDEAKKQPLKFWVFWTLQAVWVWVTLLPVMILNGCAHNPSLWASDVIGVILWVAGFVLECSADFSKYAFKQNPANKGRFVNIGPWKYARYPNYGGEILQWWGLWLLSIAVLSGGYWVCIISPLFLMCLLLFVSGVPLQEKQAKERWGNEAEYQAYRRSTFLLLPIPKFWHKEKKPLTESSHA